MSIYPFCFLFYLQDKTNVILGDKNYKNYKNYHGAPRGIRTPDPSFRRRVLLIR